MSKAIIVLFAKHKMHNTQSYSLGYRSGIILQHWPIKTEWDIQQPVSSLAAVQHANYFN
uniref:Uncharacterized protein n=1 Tax=Anguilla anguilla TaxID=7936 RepID=A0A0E9QY46_ANGAN